MRLEINGESKEFASPLSAQGLLQALQLQSTRVALMVNDRIIRKDERETTPLRDGDRVEIISMVGGG